MFRFFLTLVDLKLYIFCTLYACAAIALCCWKLPACLSTWLTFFAKSIGGSLRVPYIFNLLRVSQHCCSHVTLTSDSEFYKCNPHTCYLLQSMTTNSLFLNAPFQNESFYRQILFKSKVFKMPMKYSVAKCKKYCHNWKNRNRKHYLMILAQPIFFLIWLFDSTCLWYIILLQFT